MSMLLKQKTLTCSICSKSLSVPANLSHYGRRKPLILHCGHSACDVCIIHELVSKTEVTCKICEAVSTVPDTFSRNDVASYFPINFYLLGLWSTASTSTKINDMDAAIKYSVATKRKKVLTCLECMVKEAEVHCRECVAPYCKECFKSVHNAARAYRTHQSSSLLQNFLNLVDLDQCSTHNQPLSLVCTTCSNVPICAHCIVFEHNTHKVTLLTDVTENYEEEFTEKFVKVTNVLQRLKATHKKTDLTLRGLKTASAPSNKIHDDIFETFYDLHSKLTLLQSQLHNKVKQADTSVQLEQILIKLTESIHSTEALLVSTKDLLNDVNLQKPHTYLSVIAHLKKKENLPCFLIEPKTTTVPKLQVDKEMHDNIVKICDVVFEEGEDYKLVTQEDLPEGYEAPFVNEVTKSEVLGMMMSSSASAMSDVISECSEGFSDNVVLESAPSSRCSSVSDKSNSQLNVSAETSLKFPDQLPLDVTLLVRVSHLVSPSDFYVQRESALEKLDEFQRSLKHYFQKPHCKITKGEVYIVSYGNNGLWCRGKILDDIDGNKFRVFYIDYGNSEVVPRNKIRKLPKHAMNMPALANRCKLTNCLPKDGRNWDPDAITWMSRIIGNEFLHMVVQDKTPVSYLVELIKFTPNDVININEFLGFFQYATYAPECQFTHMSLSENAAKLSSLPKQIPLAANDIFDVHVSHVISPSEFYVQKIISSKALIKMTKELQRTFEIREVDRYNVYGLQKGKYVAARYTKDNFWYRGKIVDILENRKMKILYIDFGGLEDVNWTDVKVLPHKFTNLAPQAYECSLCDVAPLSEREDWTPEVNLFFRNLIFNKNLNLIVHNAGSPDNKNVPAVSLYESQPEVNICINALLVKKEKAVCTGRYSEVVEHPKVVTKHSEQKAPVDTRLFVPKIIYQDAVMEERKKQMAECTIPGPDGRLRLYVYAISIVDPGEFYVGFVADREKMLKLKDDLQIHCGKVDYEPQNWSVGSFCAVKFKDQWYRAFVLDVLPEQIKVSLIDEGMEVVADNTNVRPLSEEFTVLRDGAIRCHLAGLCSPATEGWPHLSKTELREFVTDYKDMLYINQLGEIKDSSLPVELFARFPKEAGPTEPLSHEWRSFNHYIRFIGLAKPNGLINWDPEGNVLEAVSDNSNELSGLSRIDPQNGKDVIQNEEVYSDISEIPSIEVPDSWIPAKPLETLNFIACPTYVDWDCNIYLHDFHRSSALLEELRTALSLKYSGTIPKPYDATLKPGEICVVQYHMDSKFYRGLILKYLEATDEFDVLFVDYGNTEQCKLSELRKIPVCHHIPIQATKCWFLGIEPATPDEKWTQDVLNSIQYDLVDSHCEVELVEVPGRTDGYAIKKLKCPSGKNFIAELVASGFAQYKKSATQPIEEKVTNEEKKVVSKKEEVLTEKKDLLTEKLKEISLTELKQESLPPKESNVSESKSIASPKDDKENPEEKKFFKMDWFTMTVVEPEARPPVESDCNTDVSSQSSFCIKSPASNISMADDEDTSGKETDDPDSADIRDYQKCFEKVIEGGENGTSQTNEEIPVLHWSLMLDRIPVEARPPTAYKELKIPESVPSLLVDITAALTPTMFVAHLVDVDDNAELLSKIAEFPKLSAALQEEAPQQPLLSQPQMYTPCVAQYSLDQQWYRGLVLGIVPGSPPDSQLVQVQFVDYGNIEYIDASCVKELKKEWAELEVMGLLCELYKLKLAKDVSPTNVINCLMDDLLVQGSLRAVIQKHSPRLLVDFYSGDSLAYEILIEEGLFLPI